MSVVIVATVGSATANSFITLAEAQTYMDARLNGDLWTAATTDTTNRALVEATRELSSLNWQGVRVDTTQVLSWPRQWVVDPDSPTGAYVSTTVIPQRVKDAAAELAFQFVKSGTTDLAAQDTLQNIKSKTVDVLSTTYTEPYQRASGLARFPRVLKYIRPFLAGSGSSVEVIRG